VGTMMTASVALGIAVDDTVHYLTWFRDGINRGFDAKEATLYGYERCATAMSETTLIAGLGLFAFAFSTFTPTQMFGVMMLTLLFVAMIGDMIFLPAILTGPAGRFFIKKEPIVSKNSDNLPETDTGKITDSLPTTRTEDISLVEDKYLGHCHILENGSFEKTNKP